MKSKVDFRACARLDREPFMTVVLLPFARRVKVVAYNTAPERLKYYKHGLFVQPNAGLKRSVWVGSKDFKAWWVEFGTPGRADGGTKAHHTLRNAVRWVGLRIGREV